MKVKQFRIAQWMGNDRYSWAVFREGQSWPVARDFSREDAQHCANDLERRLQQATIAADRIREVADQAEAVRNRAKALGAMHRGLEFTDDGPRGSIEYTDDGPR